MLYYLMNREQNAFIKNYPSSNLIDNSFQPIRVIDQNLIVDVEFENCIESGWSNQDLHWLLQKANVTYLDTEECIDNENIGKYVSCIY